MAQQEVIAHCGQPVIYLTDEDRGIKVGVAPESGAEMSSLQYRWNDQWLELIHRANLFVPTDETWRGRSPWIFPAAGRNYAPQQLERVKASGVDERMGTYQYGGKTYEIPCHGFVMNRVWEVAPVADDVTRTLSSTLTCVTRSDEATRQYYPFGYELSAEYSLWERGVSTRLTVCADAANDGDMFFSLGNHTTVIAPFTSAGDAGSCRVRTPATLNLQISRQSLFSGESIPVDFRNGVRLRDYPGLGNFVLGSFPEGECYVDFIDPASFGLRVSQQEVVQPGASPRTSPDDCYFVFYSPFDPQKDQPSTYFCLEPWYGGPNSFNDQRGLVFLEPGEAFVWEMTIGVSDV